MVRSLIAAVAVVAAGVAWWGYTHYRAANPGVVTLDEAWDRVRATPRDPAAWAALADAQSAIDEVRAAEGSYKTSLRLGSVDPTVYGRLGFLLYGRGVDDEALPLLERALHEGAQLPMLDSIVENLRAEKKSREALGRAVAALAEHDAQKAAAAAGDAPCSVPMRRKGTRGVFMVDVGINDAVAPMVVDTGASLTVLNQEFAQTLGLDIDHDNTIQAMTAAGRTRFATAVVERLALAGRTVDRLTVAICGDCPRLLGLDAQAALGVEIDMAGKQLTFRDCGPAR